MTFSAAWFSPTILLLAWIVWLAILIYHAPAAWRSLQHSHRLPIVVGLLALLWLFNVRVDAGQLAGMSYHLLGINLLTLMLGAPATLWLVGLCLWLFGSLQHGSTFSQVQAANALCVILPACLLNVIVRSIILRKLPKNVFIYIFCGGFLTAAAGMLLTGIIVCLVMQFAHILPSHIVWQNAFPVFFLLTWGEAFLSGIGTAVCVALKPEQLITFDDAVYLSRPSKRIWTDD